MARVVAGSPCLVHLGALPLLLALQVHGACQSNGADPAGACRRCACGNLWDLSFGPPNRKCTAVSTAAIALARISQEGRVCRRHDRLPWARRRHARRRAKDCHPWSARIGHASAHRRRLRRRRRGVTPGPRRSHKRVCREAVPLDLGSSFPPLVHLLPMRPKHRRCLARDCHRLRFRSTAVGRWALATILAPRSSAPAYRPSLRRPCPTGASPAIAILTRLPPRPWRRRMYVVVRDMVNGPTERIIYSAEPVVVVCVCVCRPCAGPFYVSLFRSNCVG